MRILVTGGDGFIASHLVPELEARGHDVVAIDREFGDLTGDGVFARALERERPDRVVHLAAKYGRLLGERDPWDTVRQNAEATTRVAWECGRGRVPLVYASSSEVYGDLGCEVAAETTRPGLGHNIYALSKRWGEEACRLYAPERLVVARANMPYGPNQRWGFGRCALLNVLYQALARQPIPIHRGAERSWCWAGDTAAGIATIIDADVSGVWNVCRDDDPRLMRDVAVLACELTGAPTGLVEDVEPPGRQTVVKRLSAAKLRSLGWRPTVELEDGMQRTLAWLRTAMGR